MSIYRSTERLPRNDVHHVAEHTIGPQGDKQQGVARAPEQDWTGRRKAKPAEFLLPTTVRWMETLPPESQPTAIGKAFPRIANTLAALWTRPDAFTSYLDDLLVDKRGGRQGFPLDALTELHALQVSIYRSTERLPRKDVHHVAEHTIGPQGDKQQGVPRAPEQDWTGRRKAKPAEFLFPTTVRWMETLPSEFQPTAIGKAFPRIANTLAALWTRPDAFMSYLDDLLIDKRGGRQGFPLDAVTELHALTGYYAVSRPDRSDRTTFSRPR